MHINKSLSALAAGCFLSFPAAATVTNIYILAGQSNMAGRGELTDQNRIDMSRIIVWVQEGSGGHWEQAVEPLHHDNPNAGAGPGASFARKMADADPDVVIALVPGAVGGASMQYQLADYCPRSAQSAKVASWTGPQVKGVIWHQGCSDADTQANVDAYSNNLQRVIKTYRDNWPTIPIVVGEIGRYLVTNNACPYWSEINQKMHDVVACAPYTAIVSSEGLTPKSDNLHFDTPSARTLGERYATAMLALQAPGAAEGDPRVTPADSPEPEGDSGSGEGGGLRSRAVAPLITSGDYIVDPENGVDSTDGGNTIFQTIQFAIASASNNKTILIKAGHYLLTEPLKPVTGTTNKNLTLVGENPNDPRAVLIDGQAQTTCIISTGGSFVLSNLCVTNGLGGTFTDQGYTCGGGVVLFAGRMENCVVTDCHIKLASGNARGGGVWGRNGATSVNDTLVENCSIESLGQSASYIFQGGGVYLDQGDRPIDGLTVRNCSLKTSASDTVAGKLYGGGIYSASGYSIINCVIEDNALVTPSASYEVYGGGLYAYSGSATANYTNCLFRSNSSPASGGAAYVRADAATRRTVFVDCTFTNNIVTGANGCGGAVYMSGDCRFMGCEFAGNKLSAASGTGYGVAIYAFQPGNTAPETHVCLLEDCYFHDNESTGGQVAYGVVATRQDKSHLFLMTNTVITANRCSGRGGLYLYENYAGLRMIDSIVSHEARGALYFAYKDATSSYLVEDSLFRQCYFVGNTGSADVIYIEPIHNVTTATSPGYDRFFRFESCTFAGNNTPSSSALYTKDNNKGLHYAQQLVVTNCLFFGNVGNGGYADLCAYFGLNGSESVFSYCAVPTTSSVKLLAAQHNVELDATPFADDTYALRSGTVARDAMAPADAPAWMKGEDALDLGDGTFTVEKVLDYGVKVAFNNRHKRLIGETFDIGASEFMPTSGLTIFVR